ncbi:four-carbon acid sugar kinase family protein [Pararhodonellum marinum]|uniref:four-carbon acid sugar kinase family protein n=1 Tax=Pararhodonellum marinum TaxID=2755358 RepID=UPI0018903FE0|nr:four-carbon acid sugar kinase family protein [Pararhodonellum marinum]
MTGTNPQDRPYATEISSIFQSSPWTLVVVDDDPTGTQTVHGVPVLGDYSVDTFFREFVNKTRLFFVLSNSRSLPLEEALGRMKTIGNNLAAASKKAKRHFLLVSRSDSTLRGHFPEEVYQLSKAAGFPSCPILLIPAFFEGGRITEGDIHYLNENNVKIPVNETPFAKDKSFGFEHGDLKKWVQEKSKEKIKAEAVKSLGLEEISQGLTVIADVLSELKNDDILVVNSTCYTELEKVCLALYHHLGEGNHMLFRTAASFVSAFSGIKAKLYLPSSNIRSIGGLTIVGSYVPKSNSQLENLLSKKQVTAIAISVPRLLESDQQPYLNDLAVWIETLLKQDKEVVVYTSRELIQGKTAEESLGIGQRISGFLVEMLKCLNVQPAYLIAKGGITSNDLAVKALGMKRGLVLGQVIAGVPVWELGPETKFPGMPYVVFPGNVGDEESLTEIVSLFNNSNIPS